MAPTMVGVVPESGGGGGNGGGFAGLLKGAQREANSAAETPENADALFREAEEQVPPGWTLLVMRRAKIESYVVKLFVHVCFLTLFIVVFTMMRPVGSTFEVQAGLEQQTTGEPAAGLRASWERSFASISNEGEFWRWLQTGLLPSILAQEYYNGDSRLSTYGQRFTNTVAMYNTQTVPIRFRQARVTDDSCDTPADAGELARPCWGDFTAARQSKDAFGDSYGNRFLTDLNGIEAKEPLGPNYGTEGHVVDVPLDLAATLLTVQKMKADVWLNEQTRMVAVETSWYNANLDLSTYARWQLDLSPGGRVQPSVVVLSCRLQPYSTPLDYGRAGMELVVLCCLVFFLADALYDMRAAKLSYFFHVWNWLELISLCLYLLVLSWWIAFLFREKKSFEEVSTGVYENRPDLSVLAHHFNVMTHLGSFAVAFGFLKVVKLLQVFRSFMVLWRILERSLTDLVPFTVVFLLFAGGFSLAGHWIFGGLLVEFHTWPRALTTLMLTLVGGFPYEGMHMVAPVSAAVFATAWVIVMAMVLVNMFVAILTEWYRQVNGELEAERQRLEAHIGQAALERLHPQLFRRCLEALKLCRPPQLRRAGARDDAQHTEAVFRQVLSDASWSLRRADLRDLEYIHKAVLDDEPLFVADLARHFDGDIHRTFEFAEKVRRLAEVDVGQAAADDFSNKDLGGTPEVEAQEQDRLRELQRTVERMEGQLRKLRGALDQRGVASLVPGQALEGYLVREGLPAHTEPARGVPPGEVQASALSLPGYVPEGGDGVGGGGAAAGGLASDAVAATFGASAASPS